MPRIASIVLAVAVAVGLTTPAFGATPIDGHWEGAITRMGSAQPLAFDFSSDSSGRLSGTCDIPELGMFGEPVDAIALDGSNLSFHFRYGDFSMEVHPEISEMTGQNAKWKPAVDLHLKRAVSVMTFRRTDLSVTNESVRLMGTLYQPVAANRVPLVVIVPGSDDRGRASFEYRGYGPMLAQQGFAAFVYDKRGVGASSKPAAKPTFRDYASDVRAIVARLRVRTGIDPAKVGVAGASQGGWIAPMAALGDRDVAFLILLAGPAVSVEQQELDRVDAAMRERNATPQDRERARDITQAYFDVGAARVAPSVLEAQYAWLTQNKPDWADVLSGPDPGESLQDAANDWQRIEYDPAQVLRATRIPLLAVFASDDDLVTIADNVPLMEKLVGGNNPRNRIVVIANASHAFFVGQRLTGQAWTWPTSWWRWDRRAPELLPLLTSWIRAL